MKVVGLTGALGAGKSEVMKWLMAQHGFSHAPMAGPLKYGLMGMGATADEVWGKKKMEPNPLWCGRTNRHAMQTIGTEWGRKLIGDDIWVNCNRLQIENEALAYADTSDEPRFVIDDVRFPNEERLVREFGGQVWLVERPGHGVAGLRLQVLRSWPKWTHPLTLVHESERHWPSLPKDATLRNDGSLDYLRGQVDDLMRAYEDADGGG